MSVGGKKSGHTAPTQPELSRIGELIAAGRLEEAASQAALLAEAYPRSADIQLLLGAANMRLSRHDVAEQAFARAGALAPRNPAPFSNLGIALKEQGRTEDAIRALRRAVKFKPDFVPALFNLGNLLRETDRLDEAIAVYRQVLAINPDHQQALFNLGLALYDTDAYADAAAVLTRLLQRAPGHAQAHCNLGNSLHRIGRSAEALAAYRRSLELAPDDAVTHFNLGCTLTELGDREAARQSYYRAIACDPALGQAHFNLGTMELALGNFAAGLPEYEWRKRKEVARPDESFAARTWLGEEDLRGRSILLHAEQGLGDTIQFLRYVPMVRDMGARVRLTVQPALVPLVQRSIPGVWVAGTDKAPPRTEFHTHMLSLPLAFGTRLDTIPAPTSYLTADPARLPVWHERLGSHGFRIGICWQGSTAKIDKGRSFPLACFERLSRLPDIRLISLHKGAGEAQLAGIPAGMRVETLGPDFDAGDEAFADTAAVMMHCHLVITSDTSIAHLAGALGVPVWVVLKRVPDWRWMLDRPDCPWYPSMRLFRQRVDGDWCEPFARIEALLAGHPAARPTPVPLQPEPART